MSGANIHAFARRGNLRAMIQQVEDFAADIDQADVHNMTSLHYCSKRGHVDVVKYLLSRKADLELRNGTGVAHTCRVCKRILYVCVRVFVCVPRCEHMHTRAHTHTNTHSRTYVPVRVYMYICICIFFYVYMYTCIFTHTHVYIYAYIYTYTYIHIYTYMCIYTFTLIFISIHNRVQIYTHTLKLSHTQGKRR